MALRNCLSLFKDYEIREESVRALKDFPGVRNHLRELICFCGVQSDAFVQKKSGGSDIDKELHSSRTLNEYLNKSDIVGFIKQTWIEDAPEERVLFSRYIMREKNRLLNIRGRGQYHLLFRAAPSVMRRIENGLDDIASDEAIRARSGSSMILAIALDDFLQCKNWGR